MKASRQLLSRRLLAVILALAIGALAAGCGGGGQGSSPESKTLTIANIGWDENAVLANLTKILLQDDLGYGDVQIKTVDLPLVFRAVQDGDVDAFQDMWLENHRELFDQVKGQVDQLSPWYTGQTQFGIAVPDYMTDVNSIADLNNSNVDEIIGIEPGAVIMQRIPDYVEPAYNLRPKLVQGSTAAMLSEVGRRYQDGEDFAFIAWRPHWMNRAYNFKYLDDPQKALGVLGEGAEVSTIINKGLRDKDPQAVAFMDAVRLDENQVNAIEEINPEDYEQAARTWLQDNRDVVQPWLDAARNAQS